MERQISAAHEGSRYVGSFTCRRLDGKVSLTWRMSPVDRRPRLQSEPERGPALMARAAVLTLALG